LAGVHEGAVPPGAKRYRCADLFTAFFAEIWPHILRSVIVKFPIGIILLLIWTREGKIYRAGTSQSKSPLMIHITTTQSLGHAVRAARKHLGLTQAQVALAAGVGLRFIVELEAGKPTLRLEHVLRVVDALGGELNVSGFQSAQSEHPPAASGADLERHSNEARLQALDELVAQAQELKMGYE
jgi:y4mF family transcriptional regulator